MRRRATDSAWDEERLNRELALPRLVLGDHLAMWIRAVALAAAALVVSGCDDSAESPPSPPSPSESRAEIAEVMSEWQAATVEGDGQRACATLTARGQRANVRIAARQGTDSAQTCEEAVAAISADISDLDADDFKDDVIRPGDVDLSKDGTTAEAFNEFGGAVPLKLVEGTWLIDVPVFVG